MPSTKRSTAKRAYVGARADTAVGILLGLLLAVLTLSAAAADVSVNAGAYGNNDVTVNSINSGSMVVMIAETTPNTFDAYNFVASAYPLYAAADTAITGMDSLVMVGWCAKQTSVLNSSIYCDNGSKYNDDTSYPYVFIQMRFPTWNAVKYATPKDVDLSSLKVISQLSVTTFAGTYDPDKNTTSGGSGYITNISYNTAAVYAVFGVLLAAVLISLIITCVCICKRDNAMASVNKNIIDKAINKLRSDRHKPSSKSTGPAQFAEHYNIESDAVSTRPMSSAVMPATTTANLGPREGSNTYSSPPDSRVAEREMQDMRGRQTYSPDPMNLQKQAS